jgi:hypothetical protein
MITNEKSKKTVSELETAINWWHDLSDCYTCELIIRHKLRTPIKDDKIIEVYKREILKNEN